MFLSAPLPPSLSPSLGSLCHSSFHWDHHPPASVSWSLRLQVNAVMPGHLVLYQWTSMIFLPLWPFPGLEKRFLSCGPFWGLSRLGWSLPVYRCVSLCLSPFPFRHVSSAVLSQVWWETNSKFCFSLAFLDMPGRALWGSHLIGYLKDFVLFQLGEMVGPEKIQKSNMCGVPRFPDIVTSGYSEKTTHVL